MTISVSSLHAEGHPLRSLTWASDPNYTRANSREANAPRTPIDSQVSLSDVPPTHSSTHLLGQSDEAPSELDNCPQQQQTATVVGRDPTHDYIQTPRGWKWKHLIKDPSGEEPYRLRDDWATLTRFTLLRFLTIIIVTAAIVLGARGEPWHLSSRILASIGVDQDLQLTVIGLLNQLLGMFTQEALAHIASTLLTSWMIKEGSRGATSSDLELFREFNQPWTAFTNFLGRRRSEALAGRSWKNWFRLLSSLAIGISVILLGAAMNTVVIPKTRWWPDTRFEEPHFPDDRFFFENQTSRIGSVSRMSMWAQSWNMLRIGGSVSWEMAQSMSATRSQLAMSQIYDTFNQEPGWQSLGINQVAEFTAIDVPDGPTPTIQTMAVHGEVAAAMYNEQSTTSKHNWARYSSGWDATLKVPGLLLETECFSVNGSAVGSWTVAANKNATVSLNIGPYTSNNSFEGVQCLISIENAQIFLQQWLYDGTGDYSYSITNWGQGSNLGIRKLGGSEDDFSMATEGTDWFQAFLPNLQNLSSAPQIVNLTSLVITIADSLMSLNRGYSENLAISAVVGAIFADMFTSFEWTYTDIPGNTTYQGPIRWQIYGSGPRLPWEWTIAIVLGIVVMINIYDLGLLLRYEGLAHGYWLSLDGMMRTANSSPQFNETSHTQDAGILDEISEPSRLFIREMRDLKGQATGKVILVDQETLNSKHGPGGQQYVELQTDREYSKKDY